MIAVDLFAGPGGWDWAARALGLDPLGIEWDDAACATREAAGLRTLQADVAGLDPAEVVAHVNALRRASWAQMVDEGLADPNDPPRDLTPSEAMLLIASPPCQAFSMAGKGEGRRALQAYGEAMRTLWERGHIDRATLDEKCGDPRGHLVLEPLRWALQLRPRLIACEQVEPVLPLWEAMAETLRLAGYQTWVGVLSAECYGVPQTRKRAILLASLAGPVGPPARTHQRYVAPRKDGEVSGTLFDAPDPERIVLPEDRHLVPWVSMAEALGWGMTARPTTTITAGAGRQGGADPLDGGSGSRETLRRERDSGRGLLKNPFPSRTNAAERSDDEPAPTVTSGMDFRERRWYYRNGNQENAARRAEDEPAPTLHFGHALNSGVEWTTEPDEPWRPDGVVDRGATRGGERPDGSRERDADEPAPTLTSRADQMEWTADRPAPTLVTTRRSDEGMIVGRQLPPGEGRNVGGHGWTDGRPATTVAGDPRIAEPGHKRDEANPDNPGRMTNAVRVTLAEALILQSFPGDYPVQGSKTKQFEQVGNAIPPLLAWAILRQLLGQPKGNQ